MLTVILCGAAGGLLARCLFWHVPKLAMMLWRAWRNKPEPAYLKDYCPGCNRAPLICNCPPPVPAWDYDAAERLLWMDCPSAFWLDPTRFARAAWPAPPTRADVRFDNTPLDMAVAYVVLTPEERLQLEADRPLAPKRIAHISSERRFDRMNAPPRTPRQMHYGLDPNDWRRIL